MSREEKERALRREIRRIERRRQERTRHLLLIGMLCAAVLIMAAAVLVFVKTRFFPNPVNPATVSAPDWVTEDFLTINPYSRPGTPIPRVNGIVVHYVGNPCTTARENRSYFEGLKNQTGPNPVSASSHFVIGLQGETIQCVPLGEEAYASNGRNTDTISIECCHPDETGKFYDSTYESLVKLCAYLCREFRLEADDVIRHYDVTGKICPKYFVDNPDAWEQFHEDVAEAIKEL